MVLPPYEEASERCVLAWRAKASDPQLRDGYKVCVSTTGNQLKDFDLSKPVFETAAETSEWNAHEVSLSQFAGQKVWVAFVNTSTDCTFLYVDDVFIGERRIITMRPAMNTLCLPEQTIALSVAVGTELNQSVKGVTLQVEADGKTYIKECPDLVINPGEETVIDMGASVRPPKDIPVHCVLTATYGNHATSSEFDLAAFPAVRVVEEFTGTWCEFCVRGITAFDEMKKAHPDEFIGIAIHCGGINRDPMDSSNCAQGIQAWNFGGYPYAIMNRSKDLNGDPKDMSNWFEEYGKEKNLLGALTSTAVRDGDNITVNSTVWFGQDYAQAHWQLLYTIIENDVHCPTNPAYSQHNAYAGGLNGPMGGFEDKPSIIPASDMWFQDVARWSYDTAKGVPDSLPTSIHAGVPVLSSYTFTLPDNVLVPSNAECCVLLVNSLNRRIENACKINLKDIDSGLNKPEKTQQTEIIGYWSIEGIRLSTPQPGLNIVRYSDGSTRKIFVR